MTTLAHASRSLGRWSLTSTRALLLGVGAAAAVVGTAQLLADPNGLAPAVVLAVVLLVVGMAFVSPLQLLLLMLVWLAALGLLRRIIPDWSAAGGYDPLLLVWPAAAALLVLRSTARGALDNRTPLCNALLLLTILSLVSVLNPLQGGPAVGLAGLLFFIVPTLGFWIGRSFLTDRALRLVLRVIAVLAVAAAVYGLGQTWIGLQPWDERWIQQAQESGYQALYVQVQHADGGWYSAARPFGTFSAASEYATYLVIGLAIWFVFGLRARWALGTVPAVLVLATAAVYASSRGVIFGLAAAIALAVCAWRRLPLWAAVVAGAAAVTLLPAAVGLIAPASYGTDERSTLLAHQVTGVTNPLDPVASTLGVHVAQVTQGLRVAVHEPLGSGIGAVSIASAKFGGTSRGTEADPSNVAVALGLPGFILYLVILGIGLIWSYRVARARRDALALASLALVTLTALQWFNGGQYAIAFLPWLVLGWVDRQTQAARSGSKA
jgi:hypothetical protein